MNCLVAHCPESGCYMRVPICNLASEKMPEFDPTLFVVVICPSCGKEFRELATFLDFCAQAEVTGRLRVRRGPVIR